MAKLKSIHCHYCGARLFDNRKPLLEEHECSGQVQARANEQWILGSNAICAALDAIRRADQAFGLARQLGARADELRALEAAKRGSSRKKGSRARSAAVGGRGAPPRRR